MDFEQIINRNAIDLSCEAGSQAEALLHMAAMLYENGAITSVEEFLEDVYLREAEGMTGIGGGIAIPHGKSGAVVKNCVSICRLERPILWQSIDNEPVTLIILFAVTKAASFAEHLRIMAAVAAALADDEVCEKIKKACTSEELLAAFGSAKKAVAN